MPRSLDFIPNAEGALEYSRQGCGDEKVMLAAMWKIDKEDHSGDCSNIVLVDHAQCYGLFNST